MPSHPFFMEHCLELGRLALAKGESPVGSVLIKGTEIPGEGIEVGKINGSIYSNPITFI